MKRPIFTGSISTENLKRWLENKSEMISSLITIEKKNLPYKLISSEKKFTFKKACPYCGSDITCTPHSWTIDDDDLWFADGFDNDCKSEPDIETKEWDEWFKYHSQDAFDTHIRFETSVKNTIQKTFRFHF